MPIIDLRPGKVSDPTDVPLRPEPKRNTVSCLSRNNGLLYPEENVHVLIEGVVVEEQTIQSSHLDVEQTVNEPSDCTKGWRETG